ncbi:ACT domain-containing protein [Sphingosinicella microcystinivorans]|nr:ACT domain-containing protein [Sphingosinicella microcystinivorans]RKS88689.1 hypothetical protein DFR51_1891 [Sphingosinicella microcystinivorans]
MKQNKPVRERRAMLAGMKPAPCTGSYVFCSTTDQEVIVAARERALAVFHEQEGVSFVLAKDVAVELGFDASMPMSRIVLGVYSALDGVGLTAGVATALAELGIPCNMIAAYHHDNVFIPEEMKELALSVLEALQYASSSIDGAE